MDIQISGQQFAITKAIEDHIHQKFKKVKKHFNRLGTTHIVLKIEKDMHVAEVTVHTNHQDFFVHAQSDNMYTTIDTLITKLDRQIVKHKEKLHDHHSKEVEHHHLKK